MPIVKPYNELPSQSYTGAEILSWGTFSANGSTYYYSPVTDAGSNNELNRMRITANFSGDVLFYYGYNTTNTPASATRFSCSLTSSVEKTVIQPYAVRRYGWLIIKLNGGSISDVTFAFWKGVGTYAGYDKVTGWSFDGQPLTYHLLYPKNYNTEIKYPLILSMPGSGGTTCLSGGSYDTLKFEAVSYTVIHWREHWDTHPCFILAPNVPSAVGPRCVSSAYYALKEDSYYDPLVGGADIGNLEVWNGIEDYKKWFLYHDGRSINENGWFSNAMMELIENLQTSLSINSNKIYITGYSLGGFGSWELLKKGRTLFAASVPVSLDPIGGVRRTGDEPYWNCLQHRTRQEIERIKHVPVAIIQGEIDAVGLATTPMAEAIAQDMGANIKRVVVPGAGHANVDPPPNAAAVWYSNENYVTSVLGDKLIDWLFAQDKSQNPEPEPDPYPMGVYPDTIVPCVSSLGTVVREDDEIKITVTFELLNVNDTNSDYDSIEVHYQTLDGEAKAGKDYVAKSGTIKFLNGETSKPLSITIIKDNIVELAETFSIRLTSPHVIAQNPQIRAEVLTLSHSGYSDQVITIKASDFMEESLEGSETLSAAPEVKVGSQIIVRPVSDLDVLRFNASTGDVIEVLIKPSDAAFYTNLRAHILRAISEEDASQDDNWSDVCHWPGIRDRATITALDSRNYYITINNLGEISSSNPKANDANVAVRISKVLSNGQEHNLQLNNGYSFFKLSSGNNTSCTINIGGNPFVVGMVDSKMVWDIGGQDETTLASVGDVILRIIDNKVYRIRWVDTGSLYFEITDIQASLPDGISEDKRNHVLFIYRVNDTDSEAVAEYYAAKHNLRNDQLVPITCSLTEILADYTSFQNEVEDSIREAIDEYFLVSGYFPFIIILGLNVPGGFYDGNDIISSTSRISRINHIYERNALNTLFDRKTYAAYSVDDISNAFICSRIDAPSIFAAKNMIDAGAAGARQGSSKGRFYFDPYSDLQNEEASQYYIELVDFYNGFLSNTNLPICSTNCVSPYLDAITPYVQHDSFYWGWLTDRSSSSFFKNTDTNRLFFYNADLDSAFTARSTEEGYWSACAIEGGYAVVVGAMTDPGINNFLRPHPFFYALSQGATMGEAFLFASPSLDNSLCLFGDPLTTVPFEVNNYDDEVLKNEEIKAWQNMADTLAKAIARHYHRTSQLESIRDTILMSTDLATEVDLLKHAYNAYVANDETARKAFFEAPVQLLVDYALRNFAAEINVQNAAAVSFEDFLAHYNLKVSKLLDEASLSGLNISDNYYRNEGEWEISHTLSHSASSVSIYHFDLEVSDTNDFTNILFSISSDTEQAGWLYEKEPNEYVVLSSSGIRSNYAGRKIKYISPISQYLTRGELYYFRIRQKADSIGEWVVSSEVIYT